MPEPSEFVVIEDCIMFTGGQIPPLGSGQKWAFSTPANGSTWCLEADQVAHHPTRSKPILSIEGCRNAPNASFSKGFVNHFPQNDAESAVDIFCQTVVGSFDPNDKTAFPTGATAKNFIENETDLTYLIRFQNTGTAPAHNIRVVDSLSKNLDPTTLRVGPSSHPMRWQIEGAGVLTFFFDDIFLADSFSNEPMSHGWFSFQIKPKNGLSVQPPTRLDNFADIFFDFNDPIRTNTVFHHVGHDFVPVSTRQPLEKRRALEIAPNPMTDETAIFFEKTSEKGPTLLEIYDALGRLRLSTTVPDSPFLFKNERRLEAGVYQVSIRFLDARQASGRLVILKK